MRQDALTDDLIDLLVTAWTQALGTVATPDSEFFALGGTSLSAVSIATAVRDRYSDMEGIDLRALEAVLETPSLASMADALRAYIDSRPRPPHGRMADRGSRADHRGSLRARRDGDSD